MTEPVQLTVELAGRWQINRLHGGAVTVEIHRNSAGGFTPRVDDSGGALRFYYPDGRRKVYSYTTVSSAEYTPVELAPM